MYFRPPLLVIDVFPSDFETNITILVFDAHYGIRLTKISILIKRKKPVRGVRSR